MAVSRIRPITGAGTGSGLKRRIERRVRRNWCRSMFVKMVRPYFEDDALLTRTVVPGPAAIATAKQVDVLVSAFSCIFHHFTADLKVAERVRGVLNDHSNIGMFLHIAVLDA